MSVAGLAVAIAVGAIVLGSERVKTVDRTRQNSAQASQSAPESLPVAPSAPAMRRAGEPARKLTTDASAVVAIDRPRPGAPDSAAGQPHLDRVEPRAPLSTIGQALPPPPVAPGDWKPTILFNPVATAAGLIEARGYAIAIAGIDPVQPDETCTAGGTSWPCGARARAAFRSFLRGRAMSCLVPPQPERGTLSVDCSVGRTDVAAWLVENGWARAAAGSPLADAAAAARTAGRGINGDAPDLTAPAEATATSTLAAPDEAGAILAPDAPPAPSGAVPTGSFQGPFPAAPPAPGGLQPATPPAAPPAPRQ